MSAQIKNSEVMNNVLLSKDLLSKELMGKELASSDMLLSFPSFKDILKKLLHIIESGAAEEFLDVLLTGLSIIFWAVPSFRANIKDFTATYYFTTEDGKINVTADFKNETMHVHKSPCENPTLKITFKDVNAMMSFFISGGSDLLTPLLTQSVVCKGNLNYLSKFGYLTKHLLLMVKKI